MPSTTRAKTAAIEAELSAAKAEIPADLAGKLAHLQQLLQRNVGTHEYYCSGSIEEIPTLAIRESAGTYFDIEKWPCDDETVQRVTKKCEHAPYGLGEDTVHDNTVRSTWQLSTDKFSIRGKEPWQDLNSSKLLQKIQSLLAPTNDRISAQLHKLLIYEKGDHFQLHRDTQRNKNHFATLLVYLPSTSTGGDFVLHPPSGVPRASAASADAASSSSEDDQIQRFNFSGSSKVNWVAFFTDCEHEVTKVESGYRFVLQYNLFYEEEQITTVAAKKKTQTHEPSLQTRISVAIDSILQDKHATVRKVQRTQVGLVLEHQYALESLAQPQDFLKGIDRAKYLLLSQNPKYSVEVIPIQISVSMIAVDEEGTMKQVLEEMMQNANSTYGPEVSIFDISSSEFEPSAKKHRPIAQQALKGNRLVVYKGYSSYDRYGLGNTIFLNDLGEKLLALDSIERKSKPMGNDGTKISLQYQHAALILKPKEEGTSDEADSS